MNLKLSRLMRLVDLLRVSDLDLAPVSDMLSVRVGGGWDVRRDECEFFVELALFVYEFWADFWVKLSRSKVN